MTTEKSVSMIIHILICCLISLLTFVSFAFSWSSVDTGQGFATHQFFNRFAYQELEKHPAFSHTNFPSLSDIQLYSGMSVGPGGITGLGPDVDGNSNFSDHWYNPSNRQGNAPYRIAIFHDTLTKGLRRHVESPQQNFKNHLARMAAYTAHFMQDMTCPMHVSGMMAGSLSKHVIGSTADLSPYMPGYTQKQWEILADRFYAYRNGRKFIDFFDPLYYDGYLTTALSDLTGALSTETSTHFRYEAQVESKYHMTRPANLNIWEEKKKKSGFIPLQYRLGSINQLAVQAARETRARIGTKSRPGPLWFNRKEVFPYPSTDTITNVFVDVMLPVPYDDWWRAVQLTYVTWRSTFCALFIEDNHMRLEGIADQPDLYQLSVKVSNLETVKGRVKNIRVGYETQGGFSISGSQSYGKSLDENAITGWIKLGQPVRIDNIHKLLGRILFTVSGEYPVKIPDAGEKQIGYSLSKIHIVQPKKQEAKDKDEKKPDEDRDKYQMPEPVEPAQKTKPDSNTTGKDDYVIKAIAIETVNVLKGKKKYNRLDNIEAAVVIVRMRGQDSIVDGYNALSLLIEKGYVYPVEGVGYVTSESFADFMVEGVDKSLLNQSSGNDDRPSFVKKTRTDDAKIILANLEKGFDPAKDPYTIQSIALETIEMRQNNKIFARVNPDSVSVVIRVKGEDHIIGGIQALMLLQQKGYITYVGGVGYVTNEKYKNYTADKKHAVDPPAFAQKTRGTANQDQSRKTRSPDSKKPPATPEYFVFAVDAGPNLFIGTRAQVEARAKCSFLNGGTDCRTKVTATVLAGPFNSLEKAQKGLCAIVTKKSWWRMTAPCQKRYQISGGKYYWGCEESVESALKTDCPRFAQ